MGVMVVMRRLSSSRLTMRFNPLTDFDAGITVFPEVG